MDHFGNRDIAGIREQILSNARIAFPHFYKGSVPIGELKLNVIVFCEETENDACECVTYEYRAEIVWGPRNSAFLAGTWSASALIAMGSLLAVSGQLLSMLKDQGKLNEISDMRTCNVGLGGRVVTELKDD